MSDETSSKTTEAKLIIALLTLSTLIVLASAWLALRLHIARVQVDENLRGPSALRHAIREAIDETLLPEAGTEGLLQQRVESDEAHDRIGTSIELLQRYSERTRGQDARSHEEAIKHLYLIGYTFELDPDAFEDSLRTLISKLKQARFLGESIRRIETIEAGDIVDRVRMWPLNNGSRVERPLGVVIYGDRDKVLSRAKVLCRS